MVYLCLARECLPRYLVLECVKGGCLYLPLHTVSMWTADGWVHNSTHDGDDDDLPDDAFCIFMNGVQIFLSSSDLPELGAKCALRLRLSRLLVWFFGCDAAHHCSNCFLGGIVLKLGKIGTRDNVW